MSSKSIEDRKAALFARTSTPVLLQSAATLEALSSPTADQRMVRAWTFDEIERRVGKITLDEEPEFERVYDETDSYLAALVALRPQLAK
ncbi:hypothetical protein I5G95_gp08 [Mycobacterium phage Bella96]|uniref:Uncharacterized protein n=1 Tax=Mycobacterium phage Bella96 TaxID=2024005 RepID=A0A222Z357_9CAUD|nr:hypothetical protein I5G95_gp08 [Mycobacterium phage Bella96]ASR78025.1 hypothetical protein SEA_BELLA96_95 [Mycobacterium phage Bella96]